MRRLEELRAEFDERGVKVLTVSVDLPEVIADRRHLHGLQATMLSDQQLALQRGVPYAGVSAGANVACPSMQTTNDMAITMVPSFDTFGIVPFQINPHYHPGGIWFRENEDGEFQQHFGETRARRVSEYHQTNNTPVIGLYEGSFLRCKNDTFELLGNKAEVMRKDEESVTYGPGTTLRGDLTTA